jgi:hypothetical protein
LASHKLARWLVFALVPVAAVGMALLGVIAPAIAAGLTSLIAFGVALGMMGIHWPGRKAPLLLSVAGFIVAVSTAGVLAWIHAARGSRLAVWEPTRRPT